MKKNLENAFKESLKDYEVPYNPKAWEALSAKLDAQPVAGGKGSSKVLKWTAACVLLAALVVGGYYLSPNKDTHSSKPNSEMNNNKVVVNKDNKSTETSNEDVNVQKQQDSNSQIAKENKNSSVDLTSKEQLVSPKTPNLELTSGAQNPDVKNTTDRPIPNIEKGNKFTPPVVDSKSTQFIEGHISMLSICEGENIVISNPSKDKSLVKFQIDDGQTIVLESSKSYVFKPMSTTIINFMNNENDHIATKQISVHSIPSVNFTYEANIFEKGLPVVICEVYGDYASYNWTFDGKIVRDGAKTTYNFFKEGNHDVSLKVIDRNGCENTIKKEINIRDNYNLMAVDAFRPNGSDPRNQTFMPYSLKERDAKFQLTIIDPTDNGVVFVAKDAKDAWDGIDQRTGKMTPSNKTFIWKVQIYDPVANERPIYSGAIVHD